MYGVSQAWGFCVQGNDAEMCILDYCSIAGVSHAQRVLGLSA